MSPRVREPLMFMLCFFSGYMFYNNYWKWRDCFTETITKCMTPDGATVSAGDRFWIVPALLFFVAGMQLALRRRVPPKPPK